MDGCRIHRGRRPRPHTRGRRHRGVALVEFAIALPFLALVVFGVVDGTRALVTWVELKNAAREGAVFAQTHPHQWELDSAGADGGLCDDGDTVVDHTEAETSTPMTVTVTYGAGLTLAPDRCRQPSSTNPIAAGTEITVRTETPFEAITPIAGRFFRRITAEASTRVQG